MGRSKQTWRFKEFESTTTNGRWVRIAGDMLISEAWQQLSVHDQVLYLHMKNKFRVNKHGEGNEKNISYTYNEGQKLMSKARFTKAIDKLIEVGLIDLVEHWQHSKKPTIFGLSSRWQKYGEKDLKTQLRKRAKCPYNGGPRPKGEIDIVTS